MKFLIFNFQFLNKNPKPLIGKTESGQAVLTMVLFFTFVSLIIMGGASTVAYKETKISRDFLNSKKSYFTAEAGMEDAIYRVKKNKQISDPEITVLNGGLASITVTDAGGGQKEIAASGEVNSDIRNIKVSVGTGQGFDFFYGAQVGEGGLVLNNNASIQGVGGAVGNVYSNGPIVGSNGANITGSAAVATSITEDIQARSMVCSQDQIVGQTNPQIDFAQSFKPSDSKPLYQVSLYIRKIGNPSIPTLRVTTDNSGSPSSSALASASLNSSLITSNYGWVNVTFSSPANLVGGQTYWIILDISQNSSNYYVWCRDSNNGFGNGDAKYRQSWNNGNAWSVAIVGDLSFRTYLGGGPGLINNVSILEEARANTITNSNITGTAYCQIGSGNNKACDTSQPDSSISNMPISQGNIDQWEADAAAGGVIIGNCGASGVSGCNIPSSGTLSLGPKKIIGNLTLSNNQRINLTGTLYVTGNINISNNSGINCDASYGVSSCIIIADGNINISNNGILSGSGQAGSYMLVLATIDGCNGGTQLSQCAANNSGINLNNNVTGAVFYTTKSMIFLNNNVDVKEVIGYKLQLSSNAIIHYETGIMNASFTSGPSGGWNVKAWKEVE